MYQPERSSAFIRNIVPFIKRVPLSKKAQKKSHGVEPRHDTDRSARADARRNIGTLPRTAKAVSATSGVNAPIPKIARRLA